MIDGLRPYAAYRGSPDRWLTQFPSTWEKVRIKHLVREIDRRKPRGELGFIKPLIYDGSATLHIAWCST